MTRIKVGQTLWYVPPHGDPREVVVISVGRKWATADGNLPRLNLETMREEGWDGRSRRYWLSQDLWMDDKRAASAWRELRDAMSMQPRPDGLSADKIRDAAAMLGLAEFIKEAE